MGFTIVGGKLHLPSISLSIEGALPVSDDVVKRNIDHTEGLGLKSYRDTKADCTHLAVIGGGPSIERFKGEILAFEGDVWAINGAWRWLKDLGREATLLAVDPHPIVLQWIPGVTKAILETRIDPQVFQELKDAEVTVFDIGEKEGQIRSGSSAVTAVPHLAMRMGYHSVTLFGCESSYPIGGTHAYMHEERPEQMLVLCGEDSYYLTAPDFYMQALELSRYIKEVPDFLIEKSGGLLKAMLENPVHHVIWVSEGLAKTMSPIQPKLEPVLA